MPTNTKFTQRNMATGQPPKKSSVGTTLISYAHNKALLDSQIAGKLLRTATPAETKKKLDMLKTGKYQVDLSTGKLYPAKSESNKYYSTTKANINRPPAKKAVAAKVVAPMKVVTPTKPTVKKEGMVDTNVYIIRDPQNEYAYREVKRGTKGAQAVPPSRYEKMKGGIGPIKKG